MTIFVHVFFILCAGVEPTLESLVDDEEWIGTLRKMFLESGRACEEDFPEGGMRGSETTSIANEMTSGIGAMRVY